MALHVPRAPGFSSMMKDGARFFSGLEEAVIRNIGKNQVKIYIIESLLKRYEWRIYIYQI